MNSSWDKISLIAKYILEKTGIQIKENRLESLEKILLRRAEERGLFLKEYLDSLLDNSLGFMELEYLTEKIVTGETSFFRNQPQIAIFKEEVLPQIIDYKKGQNEKKLIVWSAGTATGEEAYTLAMVIYDFLNWRRSWNISIIATDICKTFLKKAIASKYDIESLKEIPAYYHKYLIINKEKKEFSFIPEIKKMIKFQYLNLVSEIYPVGVDVIFCRNVMIYFPISLRKRIISKFHRCLIKGGVMFLGHSETLYGQTGWKQIFSKNSVYYIKE